MNVLLLGGGGREHALAWALKRSPRLKNLFCSPGNAGIEELAECAALPLEKGPLLSFIQEKRIGFTVIGPEAPLVEGAADWIRAAGGKAFGVGQAAARLEGSKVFAKDFMKKSGIPTADFRVFSKAGEAADFVKSPRWRESLLVVKASGIAAGKGVIVCENQEQVLAALDSVMVKKEFGAAGDQVVLEELLKGEELSVMALCDGETLLPLPPSQDHKRIFDGDLGPNTGGMGAYAPVPQVTPALWKKVEEIFGLFLKGLKAEKIDYRGVIYFGFMLTSEGPKALEFNVRFGDPETQVLLPLVENDWLDLFLATEEKRLGLAALKKKAGAAACVVAAAGGYPGTPEKGKIIKGLKEAGAEPGVLVFHAGTRRNGQAVETSGGRVLSVTALGEDLESALKRAYAALGLIHFEGMQARRDIGQKALRAANP